MRCGDPNGKKVQKGRDGCIFMADSFYCIKKHIIKHFSPIKINFKKNKKKKKKNKLMPRTKVRRKQNSSHKKVNFS